MAFLHESVLPLTLPAPGDLDRIGVVAAQVRTPALIYDLDLLSAQVARLRSDTVAIAHVQLCFAVKANRNPDVLRHLAALGLGADVASPAELAAALAAGMFPIMATAPAWQGADLANLATAGVTPDCDNVSQVERWGAETLLPRQIGLRLRTALAPHTDPTRRPTSRFGVSLDAPELWEAIERYGLAISQLHVHTDVWADDAAIERLLDDLTVALQRLPDIERINLGGGMASLEATPARARQVWLQVAEAVRDWQVWRQRPLEIVLEPGLGIAGMAGYLVAAVVATEDEPDGTRLATLDASGWTLFPWVRPQPVLQIPIGTGASRPHDLAGNTCNEGDLLAHQVPLAPVQVGDRVVFAGAGAYVSSMYRAAHGMPVPGEWILQGEQWRQSPSGI
ncbi:MAG: hypothetical protein H7338_24925 [Candidatus Sericytochromatia bacterium]|nr:hypothetical protein [Candidatus Sericytochromatia bacterium]